MAREFRSLIYRTVIGVLEIAIDGLEWLRDRREPEDEDLEGLEEEVESEDVVEEAVEELEDELMEELLLDIEDDQFLSEAESEIQADHPVSQSRESVAIQVAHGRPPQDLRRLRPLSIAFTSFETDSLVFRVSTNPAKIRILPAQIPSHLRLEVIGLQVTLHGWDGAEEDASVSSSTGSTRKGSSLKKGKKKVVLLPHLDEVQIYGKDLKLHENQPNAFRRGGWYPLISPGRRHSSGSAPTYLEGVAEDRFLQKDHQVTMKIVSMDIPPDRALMCSVSLLVTVESDPTWNPRPFWKDDPEAR